MKITMAFAKNPRSADSAEMISAYDEWTSDAWNGTPDFHTEAIRNAEADDLIVREMVVTVPDDAIEGLFTIPGVAAADTEPLPYLER